jgi:DsbC/DsbD-like thiol-disulfide interchange protein
MKPLLALAVTLCSALAGPETTKGVDVALVSEQSAITAGKPFTVGLKIHHHEGFHTYWRNPGIAGVPVKLAWELPAGFSAGPIQWPYPEQSKMAIHPVHGFERDVLLMVEITPPEKIPTARVDLKATATWMACADGCYPGRKDLSLAVPVAAEAAADPTMTEAFAKARAEIPQALQHWKVELLSEVDASEIKLRLTPGGDLALAPEEAYFFSADGQISSAPRQTLRRRDGGVIEITAPRAEYGPKGRKGLPGVLVAKTPLWKGGPSFATILADGVEEQRVPAAGAAEKCECKE